MQKQYEGRDVKVIRDAKPGDEGFDHDKHSMQFVEFLDTGEQRAVLKDYLRTLPDRPAQIGDGDATNDLGEAMGNREDREAITLYQGKSVAVLGPATASDDGYNADKGSDQVLIELGDGSKKVVSKNDIAKVPQAAKPRDAFHEGRKVKVLRDAKSGDPRFDTNKKQVVIEREDGNQFTVGADEIKTNADGKDGGDPKSVANRTDPGNDPANRRPGGASGGDAGSVANRTDPAAKEANKKTL